MMLAGGALLLSTIAAFGWVTLRAERSSIQVQMLGHAEELQQSLGDTIDVVQASC